MKKKSSNQIRLELAHTRSELIGKEVLQPVKEMINNNLWTKTKQDYNYLSGRTINEDFLNALKELNKIIK